MRRQESGVAEVTPATVDELTDFIGCDSDDLANQLTMFIPEHLPPSDDIPEDTAVHDALQTATR